MSYALQGASRESTSMADLSAKAFRKSVDISDKSRNSDVLARYDVSIICGNPAYGRSDPVALA
jgi:hypothetical protein